MKFKRNLWWLIARLAMKAVHWFTNIWEWAIWNYTKPFRKRFKEYKPTLLFHPSLPCNAYLHLVKGIRGRSIADSIGLMIEVEKDEN